MKPAGISAALQKIGESPEDRAAALEAAAPEVAQAVTVNVTTPNADEAARVVSQALRRDVHFRG